VVLKLVPERSAAGIEAALGHGLIGGYERLVFLAVLAAGLVFEAVWRWQRGTNVVAFHRPRRRARGAC
jgi:hypothetical protein